MRLRHALILLLAAIVATAATAAQGPDRSKPPQAGPAPVLHLPAIQKRQLANGLPVWIAELHEVPVAQVNLLVFSGSADDPTGRFGLSNMTAAMLQEGAGSRSALEIADAIDLLGADLGTAGAIDSSVVRLHVPVARLADALPIMADVALRPTFPKEELERLRRQRLTTLLQARDDPGTIASVAFARVLYGAAHRYGTPQVGTAETISAFTPEDVRAFHGATFRPNNATLLVVGDVVAEKLMPLLEASFGAWKTDAPATAATRLPAAQQPATRQVYLIDKPGAPQSQIRIGWIGAPRSTPDYFPIQVMNTMLGGAFSSRLNLNLREKHGYTYGAGSGFDMRASAGPFSASAGVETDKTAEALKEFFNELAGIQQPIPADELARTKNYVALRFPSDFETTRDISRRLEDMLVYRLPEDYFTRYVPNVEAVSAAAVHQIAEKYIQPGRFVVFVVGDLKTIEPAVKALNLGPVKVLTVSDVFGAAPKILQ